MSQPMEDLDFSGCIECMSRVYLIICTLSAPTDCYAVVTVVLHKMSIEVKTSPFGVALDKLVELIENRNLTHFHVTLTSLEALLNALQTDKEKGLCYVRDPVPADKKGEEEKPLLEAEEIHEERRRIFGTNTLPPARSQTIFELMWQALQDRTLVGCFYLLKDFADGCGSRVAGCGLVL